MSEEEIVWKRICIGVWLGHSVEEIQKDLEKEYNIPLTEEMKNLIKETQRKYEED